MKIGLSYLKIQYDILSIVLELAGYQLNDLIENQVTRLHAAQLIDA
jgi:hypothetical protein